MPKKKDNPIKFTTKRIASTDPNNRIAIKTSEGSIEISGEGAFAIKILRQLFEHPESAILKELMNSYEKLDDEQKTEFRKFFKVGEFANPDEVIWPAWLSE